MTPRIPRVALAASLLFALASAQAGETMRTVDEADIHRDWTPVSVVKPVYPPQLADRSRDVCVNLGYLIKKDGTTSDFVVVQAWASGQPGAEYAMDTLGPFAQSAAAAVSQWHFTPAPGASPNRVMFTSTVLTFPGERGTDADALRNRCQVKDLNAFVAKAQAKVGRRGDSERAKLESAYRGMNSITEAPPRGK